VVHVPQRRLEAAQGRYHRVLGNPEAPGRRADAVAVYRQKINIRAGARLVSPVRVIVLECFSAARVAAYMACFSDRAGSVFAYIRAFAARAFYRHENHVFPPQKDTQFPILKRFLWIQQL